MPQPLPFRCSFALLLLLSFSSCKRNSEQWNIISKMPSDSILSVSTYNGGNQLVHPDVLMYNQKLVLALTPYPNYNDKFENPCLYSSSDGCSFLPYPDLPQPLAPAPALGYNCDPDIFIFDKRLRLFYIEAEDSVTHHLKQLKFNTNVNSYTSSTVWTQKLNTGGVNSLFHQQPS